MLAEDFGQALLKLVHGALHVLELAADELHAQGVALEHGRFIGEGDRLW